MEESFVDIKEIIIAFKKLKYGEEAFNVLLHNDWYIYLDEKDNVKEYSYCRLSDLKDPRKIDPELYLQCFLDPSFDWLGKEEVYNGEAKDLYFRFSIYGRTFQGEGYYDSWSGGEYPKMDKFYEVKLVDKVIQVYEPVD